MPSGPAQSSAIFLYNPVTLAYEEWDGSLRVGSLIIGAVTQSGSWSTTISGTVPVSGPLTDTQLRATAVPISGPLTDTQLRAAAVPISAASLPSHPVTGPLTDTELRATAVPISGALTDTQLRASAVPISAASLPLPAGAATETTLGSVKTAAELLDDAVYTDGTGTPSKALGVAGTDGTNPQIIKTDTAGELQVDVLTMPNVTLAAGTNTNEVVGDAAHDATIAGNPVSIGGISQDIDDTAPPNQVSAEGEATRLAVDRDGALFVRLSGPRLWSYHENSSNALTDAEVHAAPAAGLSLYVTDVIISLGAATALNVFFEEGSTTKLGPYYLEAVNGRSIHLRFATPKKITAATALTVTTSAAVAHSIDCMGFTAAG